MERESSTRNTSVGFSKMFSVCFQTGPSNKSINNETRTARTTKRIRLRDFGQLYREEYKIKAYPNPKARQTRK